MAAHQFDVVPRQPECPLQGLALRMAHHLPTQCYCLGKHVVVVYRVVYRTLDALYKPRTVAAVLLVGDELLVVGGAAERSAVGHLRTVLVVRSADGECHLGHVALESAQVLAEYHLKLVETEQSLAAESLHEILVGIGSRRVVEEVLAQLWGQLHLEERGLEDAALAHEDEYHLVHHLRCYPRHYHRHQPLLEEIAEEALRMFVVGQVFYLDAVGKLVDVVGILSLLPFRQTAQVIDQGVKRLAEVAVDDVVQGLLREMLPRLVHLAPYGVLDVVVDADPVRILAD